MKVYHIAVYSINWATKNIDIKVIFTFISRDTNELKSIALIIYLRHLEYIYPNIKQHDKYFSKNSYPTPS